MPLTCAAVYNLYGAPRAARMAELTRAEESCPGSQVYCARRAAGRTRADARREHRRGPHVRHESLEERPRHLLPVRTAARDVMRDAQAVQRRRRAAARKLRRPKYVSVIAGG